MSSHEQLDPDLSRLLLDELEKHSPALHADADPTSTRRALHALKGSAGIAGQSALSDALARLERRLVAGDGGAAAESATLVAEAVSLLRAGRPLPFAAWPEPPSDLRAEPIDPSIDGHYRAEMHDRLTRLDDALASGEDNAATALSAFRDVHAMKGAAHTVGDEVTAWFCHGLEELLRRGQGSEDEAREAVAAAARWRGVLAEVIAAPERALETLRALAKPAPLSVLPSLAAGALEAPRLPRTEALPEPLRDSEARPTKTDSVAAEDATLRVPTATLERLIDRVQLVGLLRGDLVEGARSAARLAREARELRADLAEALRLIGPPRPWGAPAAAIAHVTRASTRVAELAEHLEATGASMKETAEQLRVQSTGAQRDLAGMRTVKARWVSERVAAAIGAQARREGREVRVVFTGEETPLDRRLAEQLMDPVLQLARNAVAHGIEPALERVMRGKPRHGTVRFSAEARGDSLRFVVQDDGAGVDASDVRRRAIARGTLSAETASAADDETLLALLFVPGFTTRDSADLLAGRGVGLDLALDSVHRLGGTLRLTSKPGMGLTATLDIPFEQNLLRVVWVGADGGTFGLPIRSTRRILRSADPEAFGAVSLASCLYRPGESPIDLAGLERSARTTPYVLEIDPSRAGARAPLIAVDSIGIAEEIALRPVAPMILGAGPYSGVVVRGAELRLCLDAQALADIALRGGLSY